MTISKRLAAIFAGVLLAGSFGLAGCDDGSSSASSGDNTEVNANNNEELSSEPTEEASSECPGKNDPRYDMWVGRDVHCYGDSGILISPEVKKSRAVPGEAEAIEKWCRKNGDHEYSFTCQTHDDTLSFINYYYDE